MNNEKRNKHMTLEDRIEIQECLNKGMTFKAIAQRIGKDQTTVSKEIKLHGKTYTNSFTKTDECCPRLLKAPFVCNGCSKRNHSNCPHVRRMYQAKTAQREYETVLTESREGIPLTKEEFYKTEAIISSAVKAGQNVYHAIQANNLSVSKTTVYRHIECGYYTISKIDLPRAVKFKSRKEQKGEYVPKGVKTGRSFEDFLLFLEENPSTNYVEMDTVIGRVGGKAIMTFQFVNVDFMFGILLDNKTAAEAACKIRKLKETLCNSGLRFNDFFPVLLTDNGGEFSDVFAFENGLDEQPETRIFFCDPNAPYQSLMLKTTIPYSEELPNQVLLLMIGRKKTSISYSLTLTPSRENSSMEKVLTICLLLHIPKSSPRLWEFLLLLRQRLFKPQSY